MAELFLARDTKRDELIVIKRILPYLSQEPEFVQMFLDEARIAAQLDHPSVIVLHELGLLEGSIFIAMEFVDGIDVRRILQEEMKQSQAIPYSVAAWITARICEGLYYAHNRAGLDGRPLEIIHRDVSPQNVMVGYDGRVKLVDFGIAKANAFMERSKPGVIKGKFLYLAPEQLSHERLDHRADLFAVGTMLYEITTGKSPFFKNTTEAVILAIRTEDPPPPHLVIPGYPVELSRIIMRCLTKDRTKRYQQADEIARDLDAFTAQTQPTQQSVVAAYVDSIFGDEQERTVLHIPQQPAVAPALRSAPVLDQSVSTAPQPRPSLQVATAPRVRAPADDDVTGQRPQPDEDATRPTLRNPDAALGRDIEPTRPTPSIAGAAGRRVTIETQVPQPVYREDDEPRTQMARAEEIKKAFAPSPPRRTSTGYAPAGADEAQAEATRTFTNTGAGEDSVSNSETPSITPSTGADRPSARTAPVDTGPIFDDAPLPPEPKTRQEGPRSRKRASGTRSRLGPPVPEDLDTDGLVEEEATAEFGTVSNAHSVSVTTRRVPPRLVLGAVVVGALIIVAAAAFRVFGTSEGAAPQAAVDAPLAEAAAKAEPAPEPEPERVAEQDPAPAAEPEPVKPLVAPAVAKVEEPPAPKEAPKEAPKVERSAKRTVKKPVIFRAPRGTRIYSGSFRFIAERTYRLEPGVVKVRYKCPRGRGVGTSSFTVDDDKRRTQVFRIPCRRK